jgi:hypothetical protein
VTEHTPKQNHDLTLEEVIPRLEEELEEMRAADDRQELHDIDSDTAFELGYETAIHDLRRLTGPSGFEGGIIIYTPKETDDDQ